MKKQINRTDYSPQNVFESHLAKLIRKYLKLEVILHKKFNLNKRGRLFANQGIDRIIGELNNHIAISDIYIPKHNLIIECKPTRKDYFTRKNQLTNYKKAIRKHKCKVLYVSQEHDSLEYLEILLREPRRIKKGISFL